jgi:hypothetical protein
MTRSIKKACFVLALCAASAMMTTSAFAQEWPLVGGDYWEVTGIHIMDGGGLKYANFLADDWRKNAEFAQSKGWIKGYKVMSNVHARKGEPDLYLISIIDSVVSGPEGEKRQQEYMEWQEKSMEQMAKESGNRAEYREVMSTVLLQDLSFRK